VLEPVVADVAWESREVTPVRYAQEGARRDLACHCISSYQGVSRPVSRHTGVMASRIIDSLVEFVYDMPFTKDE
jgi:hypothetical protein